MPLLSTILGLLNSWRFAVECCLQQWTGCWLRPVRWSMNMCFVGCCSTLFYSTQRLHVNADHCFFYFLFLVSSRQIASADNGQSDSEHKMRFSSELKQKTENRSNSFIYEVGDKFHVLNIDIYVASPLTQIQLCEVCLHLDTFYIVR